MTAGASAPRAAHRRDLASFDREHGGWPLLLSLFWAAAAHASLTLLLWIPARSARAEAAPPVDAIEIELALHPEAVEPPTQALVNPGLAPGGGSPEPSPTGAAMATPKNAGEEHRAPVALHAPKVHREGPLTRAPVLPEREGPDALDSGEPELITAIDPLLEDALAEPIRPRAARHAGPARRQRAPATAPAIAGADERLGFRYGYGPGRRGGPGGPGAGHDTGRGRRRETAFGGKRGHFVGRVCALQKGVVSLERAGDCPPIGELRTDVFNVTPRKFVQGFPGVRRDEWFMIEYTGAFEAAVDGEYLFKLISDDGSMLFIDGERVISNDGIHWPTTKLGSVRLGAGPHQLRLLYFQGPRFDIALQLFVTPPGTFERLFGPRI